jgi:hypothetical protein
LSEDVQGTVSGTENHCYRIPVPEYGNCLSFSDKTTVDIKKFEDWINAGAKNN